MDSAYIYPASLAVFSVFVFLLERFLPLRKSQRQLREALPSDLVHLVFNGHFLGVIFFGVATTWLLPPLDAWFASQGWTDVLYRNAAAQWPVWVQIVVCMVVVDFIQWCVHNLLHRVSFFWELHKTHHSVKDGEMDWIVSFRFQWTEVVVYKSVLYLPLAYFGFGEVAILTHAIFGTLIGHLNHANLDWDWGPLKYVLNSPNMHIWHHDYDGDDKTTVNFGIIFSTWDYIFRTAKMPDHPPKKLGFPGVETFPTNFLSQSVWPMQAWVPSLSRNQLAASGLGVALVAGAWVLHDPPREATNTPMFGESAATSQPVTAQRPSDDAFGANEAERGAALAAFGQQAAADGFEDPGAMVSVGELAKALGHPRLVLLDVRPADRFESGHIPTARQLFRPDYSTTEGVPGLSKDRAALQALLQRLGVARDSVVVAYTDGGPEAYRLWWTLRQVGGYPIRILDGGLQQWKARGFGLAEGAGLKPTAGDVVLSGPEAPHQPGWAALDAFLKANQAAVLLDTRSKEEFDGEQHHRNAARPGRIPGARHLNWYAIVRDTESDYRLGQPAHLKGLFEGLGISEGGSVATYCQSGTRSAGVYYALHQLGWAEGKLMNYDGSWAEYSRKPELPTE